MDMGVFSDMCETNEPDNHTETISLLLSWSKGCWCMEITTLPHIFATIKAHGWFINTPIKQGCLWTQVQILLISSPLKLNQTV